MNADSEADQTGPKSKLQIVIQLLEIAERAFVYKLTKRNPEMTESEIKAAVGNWYTTRPGAEFGYAVGVPGQTTYVRGDDCGAT